MVSGKGFSASTKEIITLLIVAIGFILLLPYILKMLIKSTADQAGGLISDAANAANAAFSAPAEADAKKATSTGYSLISPVTGLQVTKVYDYTDALRNLPPVQGVAVKLGSAAGSLVGIMPIETGANLRQEFELKMARAGQTEQFNALPDVGRLAVRSGEGISNLIGFSPYSAGVATRAWFDSVIGKK